jgi:transposase-like protein
MIKKEDIIKLKCSYCNKLHDDVIILKQYKGSRVRVRCPKCNKEYVIGKGNTVMRDKNSKIIKEVKENGKDGRKKGSNI